MSSEDDVALGFAEPTEVLIKVGSSKSDVGEFGRQGGEVPLHAFRELVVGYCKQPHLLVREMLGADDRHVPQALQPRGGDPCVAGGNDVVRVDHYRYQEAMLVDAARKLLQLGSCMTAGLVRTSLETIDRNVFDLQTQAGVRVQAR